MTTDHFLARMSDPPEEPVRPPRRCRCPDCREPVDLDVGVTILLTTG